MIESQHFNEWYKSKRNKELMARYRTLLVNSGENFDVTTKQDDWAYNIYEQLISDGAPFEMIAEELRMECKHIEWLQRQRRNEVLRKYKMV